MHSETAIHTEILCVLHFRVFAVLIFLVYIEYFDKEKNEMYKCASDSVHWYMNEVGARLVAKTGIPSDRHHIGKLIHQSLTDDPNYIMQIDGATGESETNGSASDRIIRCAIALTNMGLKTGDVMVLMGPNHIHFCIPHYAALYLGIMVASIDETLGVIELKDIFEINKPSIIFCQSERTEDVEEAIKLSKIMAKIATFNEGSEHVSLGQLIRTADDEAVKDFKITDFDPEKTVAYLTSTSGSLGIPKTTMLTHKNIVFGVPNLWAGFSKFPTPTKLIYMVSPAQWLSAGMHYLFSPILKITRLQSSLPMKYDHFSDLLSKYKPTFMLANPTMITTFTSAADKCDFTCLDWIMLGGSVVSVELVDQMKILAKTDNVVIVYGMSEMSGLTLKYDVHGPKGSLGSALGSLEYRLVNPTTNEDVFEPNVPGELWLRGPAVSIGYYNNPELTSEVLTKDGWMKTGDIFYRDQYWNFFFVDRNKLLLKYRNHHVSPVEIETLIDKHPGVLHVAVTGIPDKECGDLPVACVVRRPDSTVTAQEIKDIVKEALTDTKQLRGGVIFMDELPTTSTSKINRQKLKEMVATMSRE